MSALNKAAYSLAETMLFQFSNTFCLELAPYCEVAIIMASLIKCPRQNITVTYLYKVYPKYLKSHSNIIYNVATTPHELITFRYILLVG